MKLIRLSQLLTRLCAGLLTVSALHAAEKKPNILLIIADDMGYSDITCFGGEVQTPHIDALAKSGIRATNFYVGPTCSPTRSMLLSGCDAMAIWDLGRNMQNTAFLVVTEEVATGATTRPCT
jgi:arylsulfatase